MKYSLLRYNTNDDTWSETSEIPTDADDKKYNMNPIHTIFKVKTSLYAITAQENLYKYNTGLDTWTMVKYLEYLKYLNVEIPTILFFEYSSCDQMCRTSNSSGPRNILEQLMHSLQAVSGL